MKASGAIIPSTVCSCSARSSRWIFGKFSQPAVKYILNGIFQSIYVILERYNGSSVDILSSEQDSSWTIRIVGAKYSIIYHVAWKSTSNIEYIHINI